jgi:hypothetical protein
MNASNQLLQSGDVSQPGVYWYFDAIGGEAQIVDIGDEGQPREEWEVRFTGRGDADLLRDLTGTFEGPVARPERPTT